MQFWVLVFKTIESLSRLFKCQNTSELAVSITSLVVQTLFDLERV